MAIGAGQQIVLLVAWACHVLWGGVNAVLGEGAILYTYLALGTGQSAAANTLDLHAHAARSVQQGFPVLGRPPSPGGHKDYLI